MAPHELGRHFELRKQERELIRDFVDCRVQRQGGQVSGFGPIVEKDWAPRGRRPLKLGRHFPREHGIALRIRVSRHQHNGGIWRAGLDVVIPFSNQRYGSGTSTPRRISRK
jgi:hypothetical protein